MNPPLHLTSLPSWAREPVVEEVDPTGASYLVFELGDRAAMVVSDWVAELTALGKPVTVVKAGVEVAIVEFERAYAAALVGWRIMIAGTAADCLRLRTAVVASGLADDELRCASVDVAERDVYCVHCRSVTTASVGVGEVISCLGCERNLLVYHHVSRRKGAHLGFMVDAEEVGV